MEGLYLVEPIIGSISILFIGRWAFNRGVVGRGGGLLISGSLRHGIIINNYYTSDSLWKIWLVESIQSIHNSLWTWHDECNICCRYCIYHVKFNVCLLLSPLECSPQKQNGWTLRFCFWGWIMWKMYNKTIIEFGCRMISWIIETSCLPRPDNTDLGFDKSWYHAQPHPIIGYYWTRLSKISWFVSGEQFSYLPKPKAEANNWSARHWRIMIFYDNRVR